MTRCLHLLADASICLNLLITIILCLQPVQHASDHQQISHTTSMCKNIYHSITIHTISCLSPGLGVREVEVPALYPSPACRHLCLPTLMYTNASLWLNTASTILSASLPSFASGMTHTRRFALREYCSMLSFSDSGDNSVFEGFYVFVFQV